MENGEDFLKILEKVRKIGFTGVEFAGFYGFSPEVLRTKLNELGLKCVGAHMSLDDFKEANIEKTLETAKILGTDAIGIGGADTQTEDSLSHVIEIMKNAQEKASKDGIKVYFHTHTTEFVRPMFATVPGTKFDRLKKACYMQVDTYWSHYAGQENYSLITTNKNRIVHIHIKDGANGTPKALNEGDNDLAKVVRAARDADIQWLILENDEPVPDGLSDITRSMEWLKKNVR